MATLMEIRKIVEENMEEISRSYYWELHNNKFKARGVRRASHYAGYHEDFGGLKVWAHYSDYGMIVSIGYNFYELKNYEAGEVLKAFFEKAAKDKALAEAMEKEAMEMEEE